MKFTVVTLFPEMIQNFLTDGLIGQAVQRGKVAIDTLNPREFTQDVHHTVDDKSFGGGDGMVMKVEPLHQALTKLRAEGPCQVVVLSPHGRPWTQSLAREYSKMNSRIVLVSGRYAGIDQRLLAFADTEISLGDFILNGGEVAACAVIESIARLLPGVLGNELSSLHDSFSEDLLENPQFTRPREYEGMKVPEPLLSGNHEKIRQFERNASLVLTALRRPDLFKEKPGLKKAVAELVALSDSELKAMGLERSELSALGSR